MLRDPSGKMNSCRGRRWRHGPKFESGRRPVLVLTRDDLIDHLSTVAVAPITSTIRGVPFEVALGIEDVMKVPCAVNLHNAVTVVQARLGKRLSSLSPRMMREVCVAIRFSLGCDSVI